jgi:hypothetical protein
MPVNLMPDVTRKRNRLFRLVVKLQSNHVVLAEITMHILHQQTIEIARRRREIVYRDTQMPTPGHLHSKTAWLVYSNSSIRPAISGWQHQHMILFLLTKGWITIHYHVNNK